MSLVVLALSGSIYCLALGNWYVYQRRLIARDIKGFILQVAKGSCNQSQK